MDEFLFLFNISYSYLGKFSTPVAATSSSSGLDVRQEAEQTKTQAKTKWRSGKFVTQMREVSKLDLREQLRVASCAR
jgi:hypothetical protein